MNDVATTTKKVLISGAGVAGMTLAYWLKKYGYDVTIVERAAAPRDGGYAVDLRGPAVNVIAQMGLLPQVRAAAINNDSAYVDKNGKVIAEPGKIMELFAGSGDTADAELMRGDLLHLLKSKTSGVRFMWGDSVKDFKQDASGVTVTFTNAAAQRFDMVVGADGMHSATRKLLFGDNPYAMKHLGYYVSLFTIPNYLKLKNQELLYRTPGKLAGMYATRNTNEAKAIFYFTSPKINYDYRDVTAQKRIVAEQFAGQPWEVQNLLRAMQTAPDFYFDSISQVALDTWSDGRVCLLGDAAYCASPLSGQGTSLALVGAYVLAGEIKNAAGNYVQGFANYQQAMRDFVAVNQKTAATSGKQFIPASDFARWFGDINVKLLPKMPWRDAMVKMFREPFDAMQLKRY